MYIHPILTRNETTSRTGIFNLKEQKFELEQGSTQGYEKVETGLDAFFTRLHKSEEMRIQLGIPKFIYHTYGFPFKGYDQNHLRNIIEWARERDLETRTWVNEESGKLLISIADPDTSEDSGWLLYEYIRVNATSYESYGLSSWYEFCLFGVPIPTDWQLIHRFDSLFASSPDGNQFVVFGA